MRLQYGRKKINLIKLRKILYVVAYLRNSLPTSCPWSRSKGQPEFEGKSIVIYQQRRRSSRVEIDKVDWYYFSPVGQIFFATVSSFSCRVRKGLYSQDRIPNVLYVAKGRWLLLHCRSLIRLSACGPMTNTLYETLAPTPVKIFSYRILFTFHRQCQWTKNHYLWLSLSLLICYSFIPYTRRDCQWFPSKE